MSIASVAVPAAQADQGKPVEPDFVGPTFGAKPAPKPLMPADKKPAAQSPDAATDIVGGFVAAAGEFPYFVSLQGSTGGTGDFFCGGSLLSTTKVLTAAHCVNGSSAASLQVTIGGTTLAGSNVGVVRNISAVRVNPAFNPSTLENDVAILTLAVPISRTDSSVQWLRLAQGNEFGLVDPGDPATVIGHGTLCTGCVSSNDLRKVSVPIQSDATMSSLLGGAFRPATMLGAGPLAGGQDSCQGDSGGPLVITAPSQDIQIGDVSGGLGCAQPNRPGVYGELYQGAMPAFVNGEVFRPFNEAFGGSGTLGGNAGSAIGINENATVEPGEPGGGETTVWYNWTPSASGNAQIAVNGHGFDSEIDVYTGSSLSGLRLLAHNDDANGTLQSEVEFNAVAGTTYRVRVDGFAFDFGAFRLSYGVNRPAHDDFINSRVLNGAVGSEFTNTATATGEAGEPDPSFGAADASVWYSWTAPVSGTARFSTAGTTFDTTLAAFIGSTFPGLRLVAFNDDFNGTPQSQISFPVSAGTVYRIQVGGFGGSRGQVSLGFTVNS